MQDNGQWRRQLSRTSSNYACSCDCYDDQCECTENGEPVESCDQGSDSFGPSHSRPQHHRRHRHSRSSSNYSCSCDCYNDQGECTQNGERVESCDDQSGSQGDDWWNQDDDWMQDNGQWRRQLSRTSSNYACSCDCYDNQCECTQNGEPVESCDQGSDSFGPSHSRPQHHRSHRHSRSSSNYSCSCDCYNDECECKQNG